jgi:hypothetical protein
VDEYLAELPPERADVVATVRRVVLDHLPDGYAEAMNWGMICYEVPFTRLADTYNGRPLVYAGLAAQKRYFSLYLNAVYASPQIERDLRDAYARAGIKLDLGKSCLRFTSLDGIHLDAVGDVIAALPVDEFVTLSQARRR